MFLLLHRTSWPASGLELSGEASSGMCPELPLDALTTPRTSPLLPQGNLCFPHGPLNRQKEGQL